MNISKCTKCHKIPDDILMLQCSHDLCLPCAAKYYAIQTMQPKKNKKDFNCEICAVPTELDMNSVYELEKIHLTTTLHDRSNRKPTAQKSLASSEKQQKGRTLLKQENKENGKSSTHLMERTNERQTRTSIHQSQRNLSKQQSENSFLQTKPMCADHPDEEVSYFCFECANKCICPECIIHGIHKNHEVKTIKKSYPIVKKLMDEQMEQNNQWLIQVENQRSDLEKKSAQQQQVQEHYKQQLQNEFQLLHQLLDQKQQELIDKIDNTPTLYVHHENYLNRLNDVENKLQMFNENIQDVILQKDECSLLNYYGNIQGQLSPQIPPIPQIKENTLSNAIFQQLNEMKKTINFMDIDSNQQ